ncbi:unnamed protein product [Adineta ricciae]|uniref:Nuclear receptor domain-containing protein n=1 Tax=Adineta ricciae TaxID=249248 RepID=A0A814CW78_ADIRI|nr:unnamed protein product [Adineta ricciae]
MNIIVNHFPFIVKFIGAHFISIQMSSLLRLHYNHSFKMSAEILPSDNSSKKRRIMIITGDESIIEQIQNSNNPALIQSIIIESKDLFSEDAESSYSVVRTEAQPSTQKKTKQGTLTCVVCGASALGYNFDAITCESCKAFFRRNALKSLKTFHCRRQVSQQWHETRSFINEEKVVKRRKMEEKRSSPEQSPLIIEDKSPSILSIHSDLELPTLENINLNRLTDFSDLLPQTPNMLMTIEDLQRVETIQNSYEKRIELAARDGLPWNPSEHATTFLQQLNSRSVPAMRLLTFFRQIPEFNELNVDDKVTLIKYNLMPLILLNNPKAFHRMHGTEVFLQVKKIFTTFLQIAQCDQRIIQLTLIVLLLTKGFCMYTGTDEPVLNDGMAVFRAQNYYTELLWKYMETTHGTEKSIRMFNDLIVHFQVWQRVEGQIRNNARKLLGPNETNEILPIMKSLLHIP